MTYKIISTRQVEEILFTTVEYDFNGVIVTTEVANYMPQSSNDIEQNIINRSESELIRLNAILNIPNIIDGIVIGEIKSL